MAATSGSEKDNLIAQFIGVTGVDRNRASFFLESSGWKLEVALESFYDNPEPDDVEAVPAMSDPPPAGHQQAPSNEFAPKPAPAGSSWGGGTSKGSGSKAGSGRVATLGDYSSSRPNDDSDEEGQAFYAGGADHGSGQQVVGPSKKKKEGSDSLVKDIFKHAKEHGAEEVSAGAPSTSQGGARSLAFRGAGYRLGEFPTEPVVPVPGTAGTMPGPKPKEKQIILKMWKTGFSIDDGELRDYRSPENDAFLKSIMKGEIPDELIKLAKGGEVSLDLEDHRQEDYVRAKQTVKAFSGHGYMLGSLAPSVMSQPQSSGPSQASESTSASAASIDVDSSQPVTTLQLRLADGSRLTGKFNHTHTVGDIRNFIIGSRAQYSGQAFNLMTTFPNKTLSDDSQTIADAQLMNAVIVQRLT